MNWVEKASLEKILRLLKIFELERRYKVLLTLKNISAMRRNPAPYTLPVIPRLLPSEIVEGEHFVIDDLRRLISCGARSSKDPAVEASSQVRGARNASGLSTSPSRGFSSAQPTPSRETRSSHPERLPLPGRGTSSAPRVVKIRRRGAFGRRNTPGSRGEDFVPWVGSKPGGFQDLEDKEEEGRGERMTGLIDPYAARKRKRQLSLDGESDTVPAQAAGPNQHAVEGGSKVQAIVIPGSPEPEPTDPTDLGGVARTEPKKAGLVSIALQVIPPSDRVEG